GGLGLVCSREFADEVLEKLVPGGAGLCDIGLFQRVRCTGVAGALCHAGPFFSWPEVKEISKEVCARRTRAAAEFLNCGLCDEGAEHQRVGDSSGLWRRRKKREDSSVFARHC